MAIGDISTKVTADVSQLETGFAQATRHAQQFSGQFTQRLQAASAGVQDFAAVLGQGGSNSLGRAFMAASNNISQFTATMGPMAALAGGGAAVLASTLVPALLKTTEASETAEQAIERFSTAMSRAKEAADRMVAMKDAWRDFGKSLRDVEDQGGAQKLFGSLENRREGLATQIEGMRHQMAGAVAGAMNLQGDFRKQFEESNFGLAQFGVHNPFHKFKQLDLKGFGMDAAFFESEENLRKRFNDAPQVADKILEIRDSWKALNDQLRDASTMQAKLSQGAKDLPLGKQADAMKEAQERQGSDMARFFEKFRSNFDRAHEQAFQIAALAEGGAINPATRDEWLNRTVKDFAATLPKSSRFTQNFGAMERDTMPAAQTILNATRPTVDDPEQKQVTLLQQVIDRLRDSLNVSRDIRDELKDQPEVMNIP